MSQTPGWLVSLVAMAPVTVTLAGGGSGDPSTMVIMAWHLGTCESVARCLGGLSTCESVALVSVVMVSL